MSRRVPLWVAINAYARACGGDTSEANCVGNFARMQAVVDIERLIDDEARARQTETSRRICDLFEAAKAVIAGSDDASWHKLRSAFEELRGRVGDWEVRAASNDARGDQ